YWLDGGELSAAAVSLGISHPPGHPLAALVGQAFTWIPLGPLSLRVALGSAFMVGLASGLLYAAIERTVAVAGVRWARMSVPLALSATWLVALSWGWWFQAVRPEVYALQAALVMLVVERVSALEARWPAADVRPLYVASFALGLALANHHFLALLTLPAMAPTLARVARDVGVRSLLRCGGAVAAGLATYVYLPVRAAADPWLELGDPTTAERFVWVVSAETFQKSASGEAPQPLWERFADVGVHAVTDLHWATPLVALAGLYALLRVPGSRRLGLLWGLLLAVFVAARSWLGFVRSNPDALGYLMPAYGALAALGAAFVAGVLRFLGAADVTRARWIPTVLAVATLGVVAWQIPRSAERSSLASFTATDAFDTPLRRELPPRAVVIAHAPQTIFRYWGGEAAEHIRPDVTLVPVPMLPYPGMTDGLVERDPALAPVLRGYFLEGELRLPDLQSLAAERPVLVELDPRVAPELHETLVPSDLYHEVLADGATEGDEQLGAESQWRAWRELYALLGPGPYEPGTRDRLLWTHFNHALYFASFGDRDDALRAVRMALRINPEERRVRALRRALKKGEGPIDVRPFLP
ncbi:MAG: DUF2723 domain-containing protein, partial [Polyangiales bacterium]